MSVVKSERTERIGALYREPAGFFDFAAFTAARPTKAAILAVFVGFIAVWTFFYTVTEAPVPIKHDMTEAYAWGQEFQFGYHQHPPFWAWLCGIWFKTFPTTPLFFAALSATNAAVGLLGVWYLLGCLVSGPRRVAAWALLLLTPLYTFYAYKFDANIIFLSVWPWTLFFFFRSVSRPGLSSALGLGIMVGFGLLSKYYVLLPLAGCVGAALVAAPGRQWLASRWPWVSAVVALLTFAPHLLWLAQNQAPPLHYLGSKLGAPWHEVWHRALRAGGGLCGMMLGVVGVVAGVAVMGRALSASPAQAQPPAAEPAVLSPDQWRMVAVVTLTPVILTELSALMLKTVVMDEMMIGVVPLAPLLVMQAFPHCPTRLLAKVSVYGAALLSLGAVAAAPAYAYWRVAHQQRWLKQAPVEEIVLEATALWQRHVPAPLTYVSGSFTMENGAAFYSPAHPHSFVGHDFNQALWVTPERIRDHGLLSICVADDLICLQNAARFATAQTLRVPVTLSHRFLGYSANPVAYIVVITPPLAR
ncbi:glycosyltransferase family 39 protein [Acetobacter sp. TBRC 12305]|uniref:Glycosyltransferase family 39 protein n=1 Tax=Acetobacter garciniae TaxID=2817435 RepID=A0A939HQ19_9PROT|nr:glycosyltransferase family 39 protein [Acetobacter garciniae]MBO1325777.1 glycosyltransferase family 39 protein [Acetobacter garciniae]MBX0345677.1 glycosyltransferase family 39 protein [Acetobacter garciniae]